MIPKIKGLRISNAREREQITGSEFIPFQDEDVNGKIKLSNLKDVSVYVFNPETTDDWLNNYIITQEEYDSLYDAINNKKVIIMSPRVPVVGDWNVAYGEIILNSTPCLRIPKFVIQEGTKNLVRIEYYEVRFNYERRLLVTKYSIPDLLQTGDGKSVLTDNGYYASIGNLALTNMVFGDGKNSYIYDLNSDKIVFGPWHTPCVTFYSSKTGNTLNMELLLSKATATMDGIMSKEDKIKLDTTLNTQIAYLQEAITKEISDRTDADNTLTVKIDKTDKLANANLDDIRYIVNSKGKPNGTASLDASGKIPSEQLPSYVDDVIDVYAKYDVSATGDITNIKLYSDQTLTTPIAGMSDKIYVDKTPNKPSYTFRWSGTQFTHITSGGLILGTITGTAFDGGKGQTVIDGFINRIETVVEKVAMTLKGENGVELDVTCGARETGLNGLPSYNHNKIVDKLQLPMVSDTQSGLAYPNMYSAINTEIPNQFNNLNAKIEDNRNYIHASLMHVVRGMQINPADNHICIDLLHQHGGSTIVLTEASTNIAGIMTASDKKALMKATDDIASLQNKIGSLGYTHPIGTSSNLQRGFYKFATDTTSHISSISPVAQSDITNLGIPSNGSLADAINNAKNEVLTTVDSQIVNYNTTLSSGIGQLSDRLSALISRFDTLDTQLNDLLERFDRHVNDKDNPHETTKAQIGLSNVNNTSDMQKPVSTLQTAAISNARAEAIATAETALNNHANKRNNPHEVTRTQLNLDTTNEVVFKKVTAVNGFHKE